ncbi:uncharacterized protein RSE6_05529 [Rhynchosporium secalis]|uniref:Major facilitator superfamily (MFS) profile domain-containing protein n=1 Tax=Rhynchosporium secalis TaxID=38038 RepID=A0A1E1M982_RHYSE|nr:uncharacterized protein RSE6_05529 [Rhynchosporium secalis]
MARRVSWLEGAQEDPAIFTAALGNSTGRDSSELGNGDGSYDNLEPEDESSSLLSGSITPAVTSPWDLNFLGIPPKRLWLMMAVFALGTSVMTADAAVEYASYIQIGSAFGQLRHVSWLTLTFVMVVTVVQPMYSRLSDIYGRKPVLLLSYALFGIGVVFCTLSYNFWVLVISRGVVGAGSGGMGYMVTIIMNDIIPLRHLTLWQAGMQAAVLVGQAAGGIIGSLVVDKLGWRLAFLFEIPLAPILLACGTLIIRLPKLSYQNFWNTGEHGSYENMKRGLFDLTGTGILAGFLITFVLALNLGGNDLAWSHPLISVLFAASCVCLAVFIWYELRVAIVPLIPIKLLATSKIFPIMATVFCANGFFGALLYSVPYYINVSARGTANLSGTMNVLNVLGFTLGQFLCGGLISYTGKPWNVLIFSATSSMISAAWIKIRWTNSEALWENVLPIIIGGGSVGASMGSLMVLMLKSTKQEDRAIMYGAYHIFTSTANMSAISSISAIIQTQFRKYLHRSLDGNYSGNIDQLASKCMQSLKCLDGLPENIEKVVRNSFIHSLRDGFNLICGIAAAMTLLAFFVKRLRIEVHDK